MSETASVARTYLTAWRFKGVFVPVYLLMRFLIYAVVAPALAFAIAFAVSLSGQSALTDQDIARFILSPIGMAAVLAVLSLLLLGETLSLAIMTGVLRAEEQSLSAAVRRAFGTVVARARALFVFALQLVGRVVLICVPFVGVGLFVAQRYLTEFDINYYLSARPPDFLIAIGLIVPLVVAMLALLLSRLSLWALALHFVLFAGTKPTAAFAASAAQLRGQRMSVLWDVALWLAIRVIAGAAIAALFAGLIQIIPINTDGGLRVALFVMLLVTGLWGLAAMGWAGLSLGALAKLLDARFEQSGVRTTPTGAGLSQVLTPLRVALGTAILAAVGLASGAVVLDRVRADDQIEIIAHRGAAGSRPENTLASVEKGIVDRADWIEIDVQETADDLLAVVHDSDFMKLAGNPIKVWDATQEDLDQIDIGSWFDPIYADERTPLLSDVLAMAKGRSKVLIELKYYGHDVDLEARVAAAVEEQQMQDEVAIMSLKYEAILKMQALRPDWRTGILAASAVGNVARLNGDFIAISAGFASPKLIRQAQAAGKSVYVWTVNDPLMMSSMISKGVDGIITDEPALVHQVLDIRARLNTGERLVLWLSHALGLELNTKAYRDDQP